MYKVDNFLIYLEDSTRLYNYCDAIISLDFFNSRNNVSLILYSIKILKNDNRKSRGVAFIQFLHLNDAKALVAGVNNVEVNKLSHLV